MFAPPPQPLPLPSRFSTPDEYITSLISFTQLPLFQTLCGGVHILDFFTRDPPEDIYTSILPPSWRGHFDQLPIEKILDTLMRDELSADEEGDEPRIPEDLKQFILDVRGHMLVREFRPRWAGSEEEVGRAGRLRKQRVRGEAAREEEEMLRGLTVGMKPKKMHEVENFARLLDHLLTPTHAPKPSTSISTKDAAPIPESTTPTSSSSPNPITHILDIGSGQGYLPRLLSSPPYSYSVVGIESKPANISGALSMDALASAREEKRLRKKLKALLYSGAEIEAEIGQWRNKKGMVQYVEKFITAGEDLGDVVAQIESPHREEVRALLTSLHSCGNLVHHALKSLVSVPKIQAVALVGCCYNLMTEKLTPPTFKPPFQTQQIPSTCSACEGCEHTSHSLLPPLRNPHPRLISTLPNPLTPHPHGFPLSHLLTSHSITLNITARMMACQAPQNWTPATSTAFFTRHFYRALLQRVFVDAGVVSKRGVTEAGEPVILGSLRPSAYVSWKAYVRAAVEKLGIQLDLGKLRRAVQGLAVNGYHALATTWSLMAFCAGVVESLIVIDRWVWLREHMVEEDGREGVWGDGLVVERCWVEAGFGYEFSPRNLVVVGVKKGVV
ncbi:methyltransferase domain-containing protein [Tirmania nivea]|nr:methyltransferase domain-containing protein [Tirmania nivea]